MALISIRPKRPEHLLLDEVRGLHLDAHLAVPLTPFGWMKGAQASDNLYIIGLFYIDIQA